MRPTKKRIFSLFLCLLLILSLLPEIQIPSAAETETSTPIENNGTQGSCGENATWTLDDNGTLTISGNGPMADYAVASDAPWYSQRTSVKVILIGDGITSIGDRAFYNCTLLREVTISANVTSIGAYAFRGCRSLASVTLPAGVTLLKRSAFRACVGLTLVCVEGEAPDVESDVFSDGATSRVLQYYEDCLGYDVSPWTDFTQEPLHVGTWVVTVPSTCTTDGSRYIDCTHCQTTIFQVIPGAHQYVDGTCRVCQDTVIYRSGTCGASVDGLSAKWMLDVHGTLTISGSGAIRDCTGGITNIPWGPWRDQITSVVIEEGITRVGISSFYECKNLKSVHLPESLSEIGNSAFMCCTSLTDINIPEGVTKIEYSTFGGCISLRQITIPESVVSIGDTAFSNCNNLTEVNLPENLSSIGNSAFYACKNLRNITIPETVYSIEHSAFEWCESLSSISIPPRVTVVSEDLFYGCESLVSISLPEGITKLDDDAFYDCINLTDITIPQSVTTIGDGVFEYCTSLTDITIPENVTTIGPYAFRNCKGLTEIIIPQNVTTIEKYVFDNCTNLKKIIFQGSSPTFGSSVFYNVTATVYYPCKNVLWDTSVNQQYGGSIIWRGHLFGDYVYNQDATCTKNGTRSRQCPDCGTEETVSAPDTATGHHYETVTVPATCTVDGTEATTCLFCGDTTAETLPATGHNYTTETIDPTCTTDGSVTTTCLNCGDTTVETLPATGHNYTAQTVVPTCTANGSVATTCLTCGDTTVEILPATGHNNTTQTIDPTCTTDGSVTTTCLNCGDTTVETLPATGHNYTAQTVVPTCTANGSVATTCLICGNTAAETLPATGHNDTTETISPTCTANGSVTTTCLICGNTTVETLPAIGHNYTTQIITPSCTANGFVVTTCFHCGDTQVQTLPTTSHSYTSSIQDPTCTQNGTITSTCVHCGSIDITVIPAMGHSYDNGTCVICGATETVPVTVPELKLVAPTLDFKDITCINVFFTAEYTQDVVEMGMITYSGNVSEWNVDNAEHRIPGATYVESTGQYFARSQGIHAQYLGDQVYLACYARLKDGSYVYTNLVSYSPVQYAINQLNTSTDVALKQLVVSMLTYGAAAQQYFGYKTDHLINSGLTSDQLALIEHYNENMVQSVPVVSAEKQGSFANNQGFSLRKPAVSFEGAFSINYFFTPAYAPVDGITLYYWTEADLNAVDVLTVENATASIAMTGSGTGQYRADIEGISAKNLSQAVYVAAVYSDGTNTWTSGVLGYSIGAYCASLAEKGGTMADLAMATAVYGYHAKAYFG